MARIGNWIATYTGVKWFITDPHPDDVRIKDIAHALSMICRFGGHTRKFYSVAEHSVRCARLAETWEPDNYRLQMQALLHDAAEAYLGDVVRPLKVTLPGYAELEDQTMSVIRQALGVGALFGCDEILVKRTDDILLMTERRDIVAHTDQDWGYDHAEPLETHVAGWSPGLAEGFFLSRFESLSAKLEAGV